MNAAHMEYCASEDWRHLVHETILPEALRGVALGDEAIEIGPGPGFTTDILRTMTGRLTAVASFHMLHHIAPAEVQDRVFAELARVLVPGAVLVAADGTYNEATAAFHEGDTYNPIDPSELGARLGRAGFEDVDVRTYDLGWVCTARAG